MRTRNENTGGSHPVRSLVIPAAEPPGTIADPTLLAADQFGETAWEPVLRLNFRGATLEDVLNYLRAMAGFIIRVKPNVDLRERIALIADGPRTREGALELLEEALNGIGCSAVRVGRYVTIIRSRDTKKTFIRIPLPNVSDRRTETAVS